MALLQPNSGRMALQHRRPCGIPLRQPPCGHAFAPRRAPRKHFMVKAEAVAEAAAPPAQTPEPTTTTGPPSTAPGPAAAPAPAAAPQQQPYSWTRQWWPVVPLTALDPAKPYPVTLLGHNYVVWFDPKQQQWRLMEDRCPHRLAPLSEGRIEADGTLMCSYHGWRFDGQGACTNIPQIGNEAQRAAACSNSRACVRSYPTRLAGGLLFAWLESGPEAEAEAAARDIVLPEVVVDSPFGFSMQETPVDFPMWLEQGMDPTHANFLHHSCGFPMSNALPMDAEVVPPSAVDLEKGFSWSHGAYDKKAEGMRGMRHFQPPNMFWIEYDKGPVEGAAIFATPVAPGLTKVFGRFKVCMPEGKQPPALLRFALGLPHWVMGPRAKLGDQDTVMNVKQEAYMKPRGLSHKDYANMSRSDVGVRAAHQWFEMAGYENMWVQRLGPQASAAATAAAGAAAAVSSSSSSSSSSGGGRAAAGASFVRADYQPLPEERILSQWDRHTKHCETCLKGMKIMEQASNAASVAALLLGVAAVVAAVAAKSLASPPALLAAAAAGLCAFVSKKLQEMIYDRFIDSNLTWQREGGLSLVQGDPIRLPNPRKPGF